MDYKKLKGESVFVGAGAFENYGGWVLDTQFVLNMGSEYLLAHGLGVPVADAVTTVNFSESGKYRLWVFTKDWNARWKQNMSPGIFKVSVGEIESGATFGTHSAEWNWQDGGIIEIEPGEVKIALRDLTGFEGRCAGILLTKNIDFIPPDNIKETLEMRRALTGTEAAVNLGRYDFVVAGGGISGMSAAVAAARNGLKTALVHDRFIFAGNNSSEVRVWLAGETNFEPFPKLGNITREFEQEKKAHYGPSNIAELYEDEKKAAILENEPNLDLFTGYFLTGAVTETKTEQNGVGIKSALVYNVKTGEYGEIYADMFADCTGDGTLGYFAGAHYEVTTNGHMGMTNVWHIEETDGEQKFPECPWAIDLSGVDFPGRNKVKNVYGRQGADALGGWYWESGMEHPPIETAEYARDTNFRAMYGAVDCIKNHDGDYKNYYLKFAAYIGGKRESRRLLGDIVLSKSDVFAETKFTDGIVPTTWNFDVHYPDRKFYAAFHEGDAFLTKDYHEQFPKPFFVPYRCLYSRNISNLFMAGRDVSVTHDALGSVRVMRTGGMMGEVVGTAAALCVRNGVKSRDIYEKRLGELLDRFR
ncbi:MAG: FAD-dependent oxidoreductase [Oscillospiraceae bacterium]|nr:FAD-dependent oxidoreductase [Oscillospiraceae bacterium]